MNLNDYSGYTDEELIGRLRDGEDEIEDYLLEKYKRMVRGMARKLYLAGGSQEDLLQEGMLGLFRAIRTYDGTRGTSFSTWAHLLTERQMYSAIESSRALKYRTLNDSISIDEMTEESGEGTIRTVESPETVLVDRENAEDLKKRIFEALSPLERRVLEEYLKGYDYNEIAEKLGRSPKSVDNALQRIRNKVSAITG